MNHFRIGLYARISKEDDKVLESDSIINQRELLKKYIQNNSELQGASITEFCDDGFSGTHFERPSFKKMIEAVHRREIDCIIVKDFSRFGRSCAFGER